MPQFFIDRPVFAWVVALFILLAGALAIPQLPVAQYPNVAPPQVEIYAVYPGASAATMDESVVSLIEQELNGTDGLLYFESQSSLGSASITATFKPGTDPEMAQVDVQNRLKAVESRLPQAVIQQGLQVEKISSGFLMLVTLTADSSSALDEVALSDYLARNVMNEVKRIDICKGEHFIGYFKDKRAVIERKRLSYRLLFKTIRSKIFNVHFSEFQERFRVSPVYTTSSHDLAKPVKMSCTSNTANCIQKLYPLQYVKSFYSARGKCSETNGAQFDNSTPQRTMKKCVLLEQNWLCSSIDLQPNPIQPFRPLVLENQKLV